MKKFKETVAGVHELSKTERLALDIALLDEAGQDMCSIPLEKLKSKVFRDRHKKMCVDPQTWSTTKKKAQKSIWSKAARAGLRGKLYNSLEEGPENIVILIQDITRQMIAALQKGDERKLKGLYKNLGKVIK
tara:strand:+ start:56 stop:451 length:396 start_codon:yes stop_codon:yes gene_type:complete